MQTDEWMAYSCSMHFSEQLSHITYFIWSYQTQDMIFQSFILKNSKIVISLNSCNYQNREQNSYPKYLNNSEHFLCFKFFNLKSNSKVIEGFINRGLVT